MGKNDILIRVLNINNQKIKMVFPNIANNKQLMKNVGFVISDPNYEAKMDAIKNKKPFRENGIAKEPVKESFAPKVEPIKTEPVTAHPKNEILTPAINDKPKEKRQRRTKAQMLADKLTKEKTA